MDDVKRILVVSRSTQYCKKAIHYGVSLSKKYGAELYVIHVVHNPFIVGEWDVPMLSLREDYKKTIRRVKKELDAIINSEKEKGVLIRELIREGKPTEKILKVVQEKNIDLIIMLAHQQGRLEHFLFGRSNEEIIRKMPCSVLLVKKELEAMPVEFNDKYDW